MSLDRVTTTRRSLRALVAFYATVIGCAMFATTPHGHVVFFISAALSAVLLTRFVYTALPDGCHLPLRRSLLTATLSAYLGFYVASAGPAVFLVRSLGGGASDPPERFLELAYGPLEWVDRQLPERPIDCYISRWER